MSRYRGKHRAPTHNVRIVATLVGAGVLTTTPAYAHSGPDRVRDAIIECESGGDEDAQNPNSTASGLYQFIDGTWKAYGGTTKRAKDASVAEQHRVFERAFAAEGTRPWNASKSCWEDKIGEAKRSNGKVADQSDNGKRRKKDSPVPNDYVVQSGDTLSKLSKRFGGSVEEIAAANGIGNPDRIYVGQSLR